MHGGGSGGRRRGGGPAARFAGFCGSRSRGVKRAAVRQVAAGRRRGSRRPRPARASAPGPARTRDRGPRTPPRRGSAPIAAASRGDVASGARSSTPCAAASSSIATIAAVLRRHRPQAPRGDGRHADVVFLVGRRRQRIDAAPGAPATCSRTASAAAVTCAIMKPELTPPSSTRNGGRPDRFASIISAMRRSDSAPISAIASARWSAAKRDRLGVEVAAGQHLVVGAVPAGEHQRIVGHGVRLDQQTSAPACAHRVEARAHHLRLAAQAVRILHARAILVRVADAAAGEQPAVDRARRRPAPRGRAPRGCARRTACRCRGTRRPPARRRRTPRPARARPRTGPPARAPSTPACR